MTLNLEANEVQFILNVLGELPSKTGAFMLMQKIEAQAKQPVQPSDSVTQE